MDDVRIGRILRVLRRRRGLRQVDVAAAAGLSQSAISLVERGHLATLSIRSLRQVFAAVDARFEGLVSWRGGQLDRLVDERHAMLAGRFGGLLERAAWHVAFEVTFSVFGERGSIDILATRAAERLALVVEIKTEVHSIDETIRWLDVKDRLAARIVQERLGWRPGSVSRLLVLQGGATARRRVIAHDAVLRAALPDRGPAARRWIRSPNGRLNGLLLVGDPGSSAKRSGSSRSST